MTRVLVLFALLGMPPAFAGNIPAKDFAALPMVRQPAVSPDGSKIAAMVRNEEGYYDVMVTPYGKNDFRSIARLKKAYDRIEWIHWANNERLLVAASKPENVARFKFRVPKLYSIDVSTGESVQLSHRGSTRHSIRAGDRQAMRNDANVVSFLRDDPEHILVQIPTEEDVGPAVFKVNIYENTFEKIVTNNIHVFSWYANLQGEVLLGVGVNPENRKNDRIRRFWARESVDSEWKLLREVELGTNESFTPVGEIDDGKILVISDYGTGREGLYRYDIATGEYGEPLFVPENHDLNDVIKIDDRVVGVTWIEDYVEQHYFDPADAALSDLVHRTFKGAEVFIVASDRARKKLVVGAVRDDTPQKYYLLDIEKGSASFWFSQYPQLEKVKLAGKQPFEYKARDGMTLNGYLTLPLEAEGKPPLIVLPHGGPQARDTRYFDYWTTFLADRGYAVLQPNFRGSAGFGSAYEVAGYEEWGSKMQDDVLDAVAWVAEKGLADTQNMCLVGASYGGYVALTAAVQTPKLFNCYVSFAGIADLEQLVLSNDRLTRAEKSVLHLLIGDPDDAEDLSSMRAHSAVNAIEKLERPLLLIHGDQDTQVKYQQSEEFYEKARRLGKDVEYILQEDGTHYLDFGPHRLQAFEAIDEFLAEHLR